MQTKTYILNKKFIDLLNFVAIQTDTDFNVHDNFIYFFIIKNSKQDIIFQFNYNLDTYYCFQFQSIFYKKLEDNNFEDFLLDIYNILKN